jgi:L-asparaginase/Glu-tRNA(Gln) amidotransferase subunit D
MRNILGIHVTQLSCYGRIWGSFKYEKRIVLARNKGKKLEVHKALDNNVVIIKMFPGISEAVCYFWYTRFKRNCTRNIWLWECTY